MAVTNEDYTLAINDALIQADDFKSVLAKIEDLDLQIPVTHPLFIHIHGMRVCMGGIVQVANVLIGAMPPVEIMDGTAVMGTQEYPADNSGEVATDK